jgi:hypothetical protein
LAYYIVDRGKQIEVSEGFYKKYRAAISKPSPKQTASTRTPPKVTVSPGVAEKLREAEGVAPRQDVLIEVEQTRTQRALKKLEPARDIYTGLTGRPIGRSREAPYELGKEAEAGREIKRKLGVFPSVKERVLGTLAGPLTGPTRAYQRTKTLREMRKAEGPKKPAEELMEASFTPSEKVRYSIGKVGYAGAEAYVVGAGIGATGLFAKLPGMARLGRAAAKYPKVSKAATVGLGGGLSGYSGYKTYATTGDRYRAAEAAAITGARYTGFLGGAGLGTRYYLRKPPTIKTKGLELKRIQERPSGIISRQRGKFEVKPRVGKKYDVDVEVKSIRFKGGKLTRSKIYLTKDSTKIGEGYITAKGRFAKADIYAPKDKGFIKKTVYYKPETIYKKGIESKILTEARVTKGRYVKIAPEKWGFRTKTPKGWAKTPTEGFYKTDQAFYKDTGLMTGATKRIPASKGIVIRRGMVKTIDTSQYFGASIPTPKLQVLRPVTQVGQAKSLIPTQPFISAITKPGKLGLATLTPFAAGYSFLGRRRIAERPLVRTRGRPIITPREFPPEAVTFAPSVTGISFAPSKAKTISQVAPPSIPTPSPPSAPITFPKLLIPPVVFPSLGAGLFPGRRPRGRKGRQPKKYTPSFSAVIAGIRGKKPKGVETGLRLRPIPKDFTWSMKGVKYGTRRTTI